MYYMSLNWSISCIYSIDLDGKAEPYIGDHCSWVTVVSPIDRPKLIRNRIAIEFLWRLHM